MTEGSSDHDVTVTSDRTFEVRWRPFDDDDPAAEYARRFRNKAEADLFAKQIKEVKTRAEQDGHITIPEDVPLNHPLAFDWLTGQLSDVLEFIHPDHVFTLILPRQEGTHEVPLNGSIEWEAQTREDHEREMAKLHERWMELGRRHPEILGDDGEVDFGRRDEVDAAIAAEPDLFGK
jgi:hypothetical protein